MTTESCQRKSKQPCILHVCNNSYLQLHQFLLSLSEQKSPIPPRLVSNGYRFQWERKYHVLIKFRIVKPVYMYSRTFGFRSASSIVYTASGVYVFITPCWHSIPLQHVQASYCYMHTWRSFFSLYGHMMQRPTTLSPSTVSASWIHQNPTHGTSSTVGAETAL